LTTAPPPFYGKFWSLLVNTLLLQLPIVVAATLLANADDAEQVTCKKVSANYTQSPSFRGLGH